MTLISAFADEISPSLDEQIAVLREVGIEYLELRSVWDTNVLDLTDDGVAEVKGALAHAGIAVSAIGSPIGKVPLDRPFDEHLGRFDRAIKVARELGAEFVRVFSFYPPADADRPVNWEPYRAEIIARLREMTTRAAAAGITLVHENEKDIYGDAIARCVDLLQEVNDPSFRAAFDPANFIQCGETPFPDAYEALRPWVGYVHVKDATWNGDVTAAGEGEARWPQLLRQLREDGWTGFFSLEPHLASAGQMKGFSGPDLFRYAATRFKELLGESRDGPIGAERRNSAE
jgi:3-dehydroshikimate dehydratase